jgi:transcriptional regulator GlxA family with amidase domain
MRAASISKVFVAEVAAAHGFWDVASFMRDYREVFAADPPFAFANSK